MPAIGLSLLLNEAEWYWKQWDKICYCGVEELGNPPFKQYGDLKNPCGMKRDCILKLLLSHDPNIGVGSGGSNQYSLTLSGTYTRMQPGINIRNKKWSPIKYTNYKHWRIIPVGAAIFMYPEDWGGLGFPGRLACVEITIIELIIE